ncbi:MAG: HAD-IA family hydrolase [Patescibacteria group bacterium]
MYKKLLDGKKAVFFDLDGTVVKETEELMINAIQKVLDEDLEASYINAKDYKLDGLPVSESWKAILSVNKEITDKKADELTDLTNKAYVEIIKTSEIEPTEGFWSLVYELKEEKSFKLALLTNTSKSVADVVVDKLDIRDTFDLIICGDEVKRIKPNPEIYKKALKVLKLKPKDVLAFEDSPVGVEAALKAKISTVVIWDEKVPKYLFKKGIVDYFADFSPLPGNLDETHIESLRRKYKEVEEAKKKPASLN